MSIILRLGVGLIAAMIVATTLSGCAEKAAPDDTVAGANGSNARVAWVKSRPRPRESSNERFQTPAAVAVDTEQNVYFLDRLSKPGHRRGLWLRKYAPDGSTVWTVTRLPKSGQNLIPQDVSLDPAGNLVVTAIGRRTHEGVYIYKYSQTGKLIWETVHRMRSRQQPGPFITVFGSKEEIYVGGTGYEKGRRPWIGKFTSKGKFLWGRYALERQMRDGWTRHLERVGQLIVLYTDERNYGGGHLNRQVYYWPDGREATSEEVTKNRQETNARPHLPSTVGLTAQGRRAFHYDVPRYKHNQLNAWLTVERGGKAFLRIQVAQAAQQPDEQFVRPRRLITGTNGDAYLVTLESGRRGWLTRLYKVDINLPELSMRIKRLATEVREAESPELTPILEEAKEQRLGPDNQALVKAVTPWATYVDDRNARIAKGLEMLAQGADGEGMPLVFQRESLMYGGFRGWPDPPIPYAVEGKPQIIRQLRNLRERGAQAWQVGAFAVTSGIKTFDATTVTEGLGKLNEMNDFYREAVEILETELD